MSVTGTRCLVRSTLIAGFVLAGVVAAEVTAGGAGNTALDPEAWSADAEAGHAASQDSFDAHVDHAVRVSVWRYSSHALALADGYGPCTSCTDGTGGTLYVASEGTPLVPASIAADAPQALRYEPLADGRPQLVAVTYAVDAEAWDAAGNDAPPTLLGHAFARDDDRFGVATYLLVVPVDRYLPLGGLLR